MAVFNVTNLMDMGAGSLREAIAMANASVGADTITFDSSLSGGTIGLTSGQLSITDSLTINGLGANLLAVDAQMNGFRIFNINDGNDGNLIDVLIDGLKITGGRETGAFPPILNDGGGILNQENLTLTNSTVSGNRSSSFGGGIANRNGTTTIINSTISGNETTLGGGGIASSNGTVNIINSTISGNGGNVGTSDLSNSGGGIDNYNGTLNITNSTISGNSAYYGGGIVNSNGTATIANSTISDNFAFYSGGGIQNINSSTLNMTNTIIANSSGGDCRNNSTIVTNVNNLIEDGSCNPFQSGDPNLGPLQNNGGPTATHELLPGSIAIDRGNNAGAAGLPFDQRGSGFDRIVGGTVDIGAFEVQAQQPPQPVPEPSSVIGLVTFGVGTLTIGKHKLAKMKKKTKDKNKT